MQFLPKWTKNVSKFILFHKRTAIIKFSIFNFLPIFIFLKCFGRYLKRLKIANLGYGNGRNSKNETLVWQDFWYRCEVDVCLQNYVSKFLFFVFQIWITS